jgi:hypothetical protein
MKVVVMVEGMDWAMEWAWCLAVEIENLQESQIELVVLGVMFGEVVVVMPSFLLVLVQQV